MAVVSARSGEGLLAACGPENSGAGGKGRFGLLLYLEEGVPGRGLPLRSAGSYGMSAGGGRDTSDEFRVSVCAVLVGEPLAGMYGR